MYRPSKPAYGMPPFGPPPPHSPTYRPRGPCGVPPSGLMPPAPCGPFSAPTPNNQFVHSRPPGGHFMRPQFSSFSIDHNRPTALGGSQQMVSPAEPPHHQVPQWNPTPVKQHPQDNSDRAGEEFLRCIADNKPLPDYLKVDMASNLADALKTASVLKEAVKSDLQFQKHMTRSKSRSRSRSRGRSRGKSRVRSHARSKSRARSRSRGRQKSRPRGRSRARSKSRSPSQSRSKSHVRSKSKIRRSRSRSGSSEKSRAKDRKRKRSPGHNCSSSESSSNLPGNSLLEGLKMVIKSRELEEKLPTLKDAILTIQASDESKTVECVPKEYRHQENDSQENLTSVENDSMLLPHDRVGSDFSWLQAHSQEDFTVQKADELEDEESFLYGKEDTGKNEANTFSTTLFPVFSQIGEHAKLQKKDVSALSNQQYYQNMSSFGNVLDQKQPCHITSLSLASASLDSSEYEKIKNILKSVGTADVGEIGEIMKMQGQSAAHVGSVPAANLTLPALSNPNVRHALESLQSLIKATKEKRTKGDSSGTSQTSEKHKAHDDKERKEDIQATISQMESLMKQLEGLLKQDEVSFLTPVLGLYCQKCEEFIGDLSCADSHAAIHRHSNSSCKVDKHRGDSKEHSRLLSNSSQQLHHSDRKDHTTFSYHGDSGDHGNHKDYQRDWRDKRDHKSKPKDGFSAKQENVCLKEEFKKERMLITVSCVGNQGKVTVKEKDGKAKSSKDSKERDGSSNRDSEKEKTPKAKSHKKKKKKKKKKKEEDRS